MKMKGELTRLGKRAAKSVTEIEKMEAYRRVDNGETKASVARDIGVPESTFRGWYKADQEQREKMRMSLSPEIEANSLQFVGSNPTSVASVKIFYGGDTPGTQKLKTSRRKASKSYGVKENIENDATKLHENEIDYMKMMAATWNARRYSEPRQIALLQQYNMGYSFNYPKSLMDYPNMMPSSANNGFSASLVANGLQYTKNSNTKPSSRHSIGVATPVQKTSDICAMNSGRKSMPFAEEAPSFSLMDPRKSPELGRDLKNKIRNPAPNQGLNYSNNYQNNVHNTNNLSNDYSNATSLNNNIVNNNNNNNVIMNNNNVSLNDNLWMCKLAQQQAIDMATNSDAQHKNRKSLIFARLMQNAFRRSQNMTVTPGASLDSMPTPVCLTTTTAMPTPEVPQTKQDQSFNSKNRAILDQILCDNNNTNDNVMSSINGTAANSNGNSHDGDEDDEENKSISQHKAIEQGKKFLSFLLNASIPSITSVQIYQLQTLLQKLEEENLNVSVKKSRKNSVVIRYTPENSELSDNTE